MQEENKTEVVEIEEAKVSVLDRTRKAMRRSKKKIFFSKICSVTIPIIVAILLIGYPIIMHNINNGRSYSKPWKNMIQKIIISYEDLEKTQSVSIQELNKAKDAEFYWLDNMTRTESYILTYKGKNALIEEHYLYEDIECILYVMNTNSQIDELSSANIYENKYIKDVNIRIDYSIFDQYAYGKMKEGYDYILKINSTDASTIETILSNLTNS